MARPSQAHLTATRAAIVMTLEPVFAAFFAVPSVSGEESHLADAGRRRPGPRRDVPRRAPVATARPGAPAADEPPSRPCTTTCEPRPSAPALCAGRSDPVGPLTPFSRRTYAGVADRAAVARSAWEVPCSATTTPSRRLAVKDLQVARDFYEGVLGLSPRGDAPEGVLYGAGSGAFLVYPSSFAGTNRATAMSFQVPGWPASTPRSRRYATKGVRSRPSTPPASAGTTASRRWAGTPAGCGSRTPTATSSTSRRVSLPAERLGAAQAARERSRAVAASTAASVPASSTSRCHTARTRPGPTAYVRTPCSSSAATNSVAAQPTAPTSSTTMLVSTVAASMAAGAASRARRGEAGRAGVVVGEPLDVVVEGVEPGRGEDADLAHAGAVALAPDPRLGHLLGRADEHRADRRAQALATGRR